MTKWQPYREPLRVTLVRTITIAVVVATVVATSSHDIPHWPALVVVMLWPSFGGHWIDLWYLNWLRPRLPAARSVQLAARLVVWFAGGVLVGIGVRMTASGLFGRPRIGWLTWATAGAAFILIELVAHAALQARGRPSFYNGLG
jgi:hypothetical protein